MKMKKVLSMMCAAMLVACMAMGCSSGGSGSDSGSDSSSDSGSSEEAKDEGGEINVTFCISHMTNAWAIEASESMQAAAKENGVNLTVVEAEQDINKQVSQIESAVSQKMDAIIIEPVSTDGVLAAVSSAEEAGVPVIVYNQNISDPSRATAFVGVSNEELGKMEMDRALADIGGKGNIALLLGPRGSEGQLGRSSGYEKALKENPDVKVAFEEEAAWTTEDALKLVENWLQTGTELAAVVSQNDNMALGAIKAIEDKNLQDSIKVYGMDAVPDALTAVKEGRLTLSVSQSTSSQSEEAIKAAVKLANGETIDKEILVTPEIIDSENVDNFLK